MELIRAMKRCENGLPRCGERGRHLGVRVSKETSSVIDIEVDSTGRVRPGIGGMSVVLDTRYLPPALLPPPIGYGKDSVYSIEERNLGPMLCYRPDSTRASEHGFVEPKSEIAIEAYQAALCATARSWRHLL